MPQSPMSQRRSARPPEWRRTAIRWRRCSLTCPRSRRCCRHRCAHPVRHRTPIPRIRRSTMADLFVKIDELADYATFFAKLAGDSEAASKGLVQGFAAFDNAWGGDAPGAAFFGAYAEPAADTLGCAQQVPVQLTALSTAMTDTADAYLGTELANTNLAGGATTA